MIKISLLGCGNIGRFIANAIDRGIINCKLVKIFDKSQKTIEDFNKGISFTVPVADNIEDLVRGSDLVVEAASQEAVREYATKILSSGKHLMIMSVGALVDDALFREMRKIAREKNLRIYIPSGAIVGLDGINAAKLVHIDSVEITTRKSPKTLGVNVKEETVLYDGPAIEGIKKFPRSVNVAATLGLAGIGLERTRLRVIADPMADKNIHEVQVNGDFGKFKTITENVPSLQNPKTSWLAALSAIATLKKICNVVQFGT
ncbi:MAG: aspartate dehydrogenase [Candidatus Altiarchaeales archaeon]|nr:MAG: aspartate dehydrogenase [Candidatus Altiarchaeales archaeon]